MGNYLIKKNDISDIGLEMRPIQIYNVDTSGRIVATDRTVECNEDDEDYTIVPSSINFMYLFNTNLPTLPTLPTLPDLSDLAYTISQCIHHFNELTLINSNSSR